MTPQEKAIIDKLEMSDELIVNHLEWLAKSKNNGLNEDGTNTIIRFLLKKVSELESKINDN